VGAHERPVTDREGGMEDERGAMDVTTVVVIDHQPLFRAGVRHALERDAGAGACAVVSEVGDGATGVQRATAYEPSVVVLTVEPGGLAGLETIRALKRAVPGVAVVVLTGRTDAETLFYAIRYGAIRYGAAAYLTKDVDPATLADAVRQVARGRYLINDSLLSAPTAASRVLDSFRDLGVGADRAIEQLYMPISAREVEVLECIAKGNSNKEIARALGISDQTVKNHIGAILRKLAVNDRTQAVVHALRHGWIDA